MSLNAEVGDLIEIAAAHVGASRQIGEILEVLNPHGHQHYRVRWEDEHESLFYPGPGAGVVRRAKDRESDPVLVHEA